MDDHTPNTGIVIFVDSTGIQREIDFIDAPLGLTARDVRNTAVEYELPGTNGQRAIRFWLMHPERCMESRVINTVELGRTDRLALRQLQVSVVCARIWSSYLLDSDEIAEERRQRVVLKLNERVFRKCMKDRRFHQVMLDHRIDPFDAVLVNHPRLPDRIASVHGVIRKWSTASKTVVKGGRRFLTALRPMGRRPVLMVWMCGRW